MPEAQRLERLEGHPRAAKAVPDRLEIPAARVVPAALPVMVDRSALAAAAAGFRAALDRPAARVAMARSGTARMGLALVGVEVRARIVPVSRELAGPAGSTAAVAEVAAGPAALNPQAAPASRALS